MSEILLSETLQNLISALDTSKDPYLLPLVKSVHDKNISISDWNLLVNRTATYTNNVSQIVSAIQDILSKIGYGAISPGVLGRDYSDLVEAINALPSVLKDYIDTQHATAIQTVDSKHSEAMSHSNRNLDTAKNYAKGLVDDASNGFTSTIDDFKTEVNTTFDNMKKSQDVENLTATNVTVENLNVTGTATVTNQETLTVEDNLIITNGTGLDLGSVYSGIVTLTGKSDTDGNPEGYGIVYNPAGSVIMLGKGYVKENTSDGLEFEFDFKEGQAIATRAENIANDHLLQWNSAGSVIVDSGHTLKDLTDYTDSKVTETVERFSSVADTKLDKVTKTAASDYVYAVQGSTQKTIQVATGGAGAYTIVGRNKDGNIVANDPTADAHVATKSYVDSADSKIAGEQLALSARFDNLSGSFNNLSNTVSSKLDAKKASDERTYAYLYTKQGQKNLSVSAGATSNSIALRDHNGEFLVGSGTEYPSPADRTVANKAFVTNEVGKKRDTVNVSTSDTNTYVYTASSSGQSSKQVTSEAVVGALPLRNSEYTFEVGELDKPPTSDLSAVNKDYVDRKIQSEIKNAAFGDVDLSKTYATLDYVDGAIDNVIDNAAFLSTTTPTVHAVGGLPAGTDLSTYSLREIISQILIPYVGPSITSVSRYPNNTYIEYGAQLSIGSVTAQIKKGTYDIVKAELYNGSKLLQTVTSFSGTSVQFTGLAINITDGTRLTVKITASDGATVEKQTSAVYNVSPYYTGVCTVGASITESLIKSLSKNIKPIGSFEQSFTCNNERIVIAYPATSNAISKIIASNTGFDITTSFTQSTLSIPGLDGKSRSYRVYVSEPRTVTDFNIRFEL